MDHYHVRTIVFTPSRTGGKEVPALESFRLSDGSTVTRQSQGHYRIVKLSINVVSTDPNAPWYRARNSFNPHGTVLTITVVGKTMARRPSWPGQPWSDCFTPASISFKDGGAFPWLGALRRAGVFRLMLARVPASPRLILAPAFGWPIA